MQRNILNKSAVFVGLLLLLATALSVALEVFQSRETDALKAQLVIVQKEYRQLQATKCPPANHYIYCQALDKMYWLYSLQDFPDPINSTIEKQMLDAWGSVTTVMGKCKGQYEG
jgi:hypothetical protein